MKTFNKQNKVSAIIGCGFLWFATASPALAVPPMPGFNSLDAVTVDPFNPYTTPGADVNLSDAKLYGGVNAGPGPNTPFIEWVIDLAQPAGAGHSIYGDYDYIIHSDGGSLNAALYVDPDGTGSAMPQLIVGQSFNSSTLAHSSPYSGPIPSISLPVGATEISVRLEGVAAFSSGFDVPNGSIDLFYVVPEPSSFAQCDERRGSDWLCPPATKAAVCNLKLEI